MIELVNVKRSGMCLEGESVCVNERRRSESVSKRSLESKIATYEANVIALSHWEERFTLTARE